jgi:hypothetical protein
MVKKYDLAEMRKYFKEHGYSKEELNKMEIDNRLPVSKDIKDLPDNFTLRELSDVLLSMDIKYCEIAENAYRRVIVLLGLVKNKKKKFGLIETVNKLELRKYDKPIILYNGITLYVNYGLPANRIIKCKKRD